VVGYVKGTDTVVSFSIFAETPAENGFAPFGDYTPVTDMGDYWVFESGPVVTHDSLITIEKVWYGPKWVTPKNQFFIECLKVYVNKDTTVNRVRVAEAVDWDIPSDSGSDNNSGFDFSKKLIYQQGVDYGNDGVAPCDNDKRFGGMDFIAGYRNDTLYKSTPHSAFTKDNDTYVYPRPGFVPEQLFANMTPSGFSTSDSTEDDLHAVIVADTNVTLAPGTVYKFYFSFVTAWNSTLAEFLVCVDSQLNALNRHIFTGACCDDTVCSITTHALCNAAAGTFKGVGTDCDPNPCAGCCHPSDAIRGDVNMNGSVNITDVTYLVAFLKGVGPIYTCLEEADLNVTGNVNITDVTYLVAYLKGVGPLPPSCP
jgi:hypothetical protein